MRILTSFLILATAFFAVGCTGANQNSACYQAITADDGAVVTTTALYREGLVTKANAETAYTAAAVAEAGLYVWSQQLISAPSTTQPASVTTALANLEAQLQAVANGNATLKARVKDKATYGQVSPTEIIAIIQLVSALEPGAAELLNALTSQSSVTPAQITTALAQLNSDLAALSTSLANPPVVVVPPAPVPAAHPAK